MPTTDDVRQIVLADIPTTLGDFIALRDEVAVTPEGGAVMMVIALMVYVENPQGRVGQDALVMAVDRSRLTPSSAGYKGWALSVRDQQHIRHQMGSNPWAPRSYFVGTSPDSGYTLPQPPYRFELSRNPYSGVDDDEHVRVFVATSGASTPRPVSLQRNNRGIWKALEWSSLTVGVEHPVAQVDDDL